MRSMGMLIVSWALLALAAISLSLAGSMAMDVGTPGKSATYSAVFCLLGIALTIATAGVGLLMTVRQARARARQEAIEAEVLRIALARDGRITAAEVAMSSELSLTEAQAYLEQMARGGHISAEVGEQGVMVYNINAP